MKENLLGFFFLQNTCSKRNMYVYIHGQEVVKRKCYAFHMCLFQSLLETSSGKTTTMQLDLLKLSSRTESNSTSDHLREVTSLLKI